MTQKELLTIEDLCETLGIGRNAAYKILKNGDIPSIRLGKRRMVRLQDVSNYINQKFEQHSK